MESLFSFGKAALILLQVIVIFNLLIVVHELGHFLAGRRRQRLDLRFHPLGRGV